MFGPETGLNNIYRNVINDGVLYVNRNQSFLGGIHELKFIDHENKVATNSIFTGLQDGKSTTITMTIEVVFLHDVWPMVSARYS